MGKENRYHDEEASRIAKRHDEEKKKNDEAKAQKERDRIAKYEKPHFDKKAGHEIQMIMHELLTETPEASRNKTWFDKWKAMRKRAEDLGIYTSLVSKYQNLGRIPA